MSVPQLDRARHMGARFSVLLFLVALMVIVAIAADATIAPALLAHVHIIGQPALANTCAGSQVPC